MTYKIRRYDERDLPAVLAAWEAASKVAHPFLTDEFIASERGQIARVYMPLAETWVIESQGDVVGFTALIEDEVGAIFLQPSHHGKGAGRALMDKAKEVRGVLELDVFEANTLGRRFYESVGFVEIGRGVHEETGNRTLRLRFDPAD